MKKWRFLDEIILPTICVIIGIALAVYSINDYAKECNSMSWTSTDAITVDLDSHEVSSVKRSHTYTIYEITYEYEVNGESYTGFMYSENPVALGQVVEIKYNPDNPASSTSLLKPDTQRFAIILVISIVLIVGGLVFVIILLKHNRLFKYIGEDKPYYHAPEQRANLKSYLLLLIPIGVFVFSFLAMYIQSNSQVSSTEFVQIMYEDGYEAEDSLDRLQAEYQVGSLIDKAYSVNTENLRLDFCVINSSYNARMLYDSLRLPGDVYVMSDNYLLAAENEDIFSIKAYNNDIFVYGACKPEYKDELLHLLEDINYYNGQ